MSVCSYLGRSQLSGFEELRLVGRENLFVYGRASLILHSWREVIADDVVREVPFGGGGVGVGGEVEDYHPVSMHILDRGHVCLDLDEKDGDHLGVSSVVVCNDGII